MNQLKSINKHLTTTFGCSKSKLESTSKNIDMHGGISFLKWAGGKGQIMTELEKFIPHEFNNYFEPFVGGGSLFFHIKKKYPNKKAIISDINEELINSYLVIKYHLKKIIEELKKHKENYDKKGIKYYYKIRKVKPKTLSAVERAARFIFLNKTCWNGLFRVNSKEEFNVPAGKYKKPQIFDEERLKLIRKLLKNTIIKVSDFSEVIKFARVGDFIYFDPPYYPISKTSKFTDYTKSGFKEKDQKNLARVFRELDNRGCFVLLSNSDAKFIRNLYRDFKIKSIMVKRMINCIGSKRGPVNELLITNY